MKKRLIALLLSTTLLCPLSACRTDPTPDPSSTSDTTSADTETSAPADLVLIGENAETYAIIRGDNANKTEIDAAVFLRKYLAGAGMDARIITDWEKNPVSDYEIVVGDSTRLAADESLGLSITDLGEEGWFVKVSGARIYIAGGTPEKTRTAVEFFLAEFLDYTGEEETGAPVTTLTVPGDYEHIERQNFAISSVTMEGRSLADYGIVVESTDVKARDAAEKLRDTLYAQSGVWVEVVGRHDTWDGPTILFSAESPALSGHFEIYADDGTLVCRTDVKNGFLRGVTAFLDAEIVGKSGDIAFDQNYTFDAEIGSYVLYSDYGAKGDGVTNDMNAIIQAHAAANATGAEVRAEAGATYYIGYHTESAIIQTNTDWTGASFILDDTKMDDAHRTVYAFKITSPLKSYSVLDQLKGTTIAEGQSSLPITLAGEKEALLVLTDESTKRYIRSGANQNAGFNQQEAILLDADGNVDEQTPVIWDWEQYSSAKVYPIPTTTLTVTGGTFTTLVNRESSRPRFYTTGIGIFRSNVVIDGVEHYVVDDGTESAPYYGFFNSEDCAYVTIRNCIVTPHWTHVNNPTGNGLASQGTYDLCSTRVVYLTYQNVTQSIDIMDNTYWGVIASKFCKNITLDSCIFSRFDSHEGVANATILNCELGYQGLNAIGFGTLRVENTTIHNSSFINLRSDYGSTWKGDFIIKNCTWDPGRGNTLTAGNYFFISGSHDAFHDYGFACFMPTTITIDGLHIADAKNASGYTGVYLLGNIVSSWTGEAYEKKVEKQGARLYEVTKTLTVRGITSDSGKGWRLSTNEYMYKDMQVIQN